MSEYKTLFGIAVLPTMMLMAILAATMSRRLRDVFFFLFVLLCIDTNHLDVNFVSKEWYRGTTRGFEMSLLDVLSVGVLFSSLLRPAPGQKRFYWPASLALILIYFLYACFSVSISDPQLFGLFELSKIVRGLVVFLAAALYVREEKQLRVLVWALACVAIWQAYVVLKQRYIMGIHRVEGTIGNPNSLSMFLCMISPIFIAAINSEFPRLLKLVCAAAIMCSGLCLLLTISRAGVATLVVVLTGCTLATVSYKITFRKMVISAVVLVMAIGMFAKAWHTLQSRYSESSLKDEYEGKGQNRGYYLVIAEAIALDRLFGVGLNNWSYWVSNEYGPKLGWRFVPYIGTEKWPSDKVPPGRNIDAAQAAPAHNLGALTVGELGIPGLFIFTLLWFRWFQMGASFLWPRSDDPMLRLGAGIFFCTWGIFLQSITEWVYRLTPIFFTFHVLMGALASLYFAKRERKRRALEEPEDSESKDEDSEKEEIEVETETVEFEPANAGKA